MCREPKIGCCYEEVPGHVFVCQHAKKLLAAHPRNINCAVFSLRRASILPIWWYVCQYVYLVPLNNFSFSMYSIYTIKLILSIGNSRCWKTTKSKQMNNCGPLPTCGVRASWNCC